MAQLGDWLAEARPPAHDLRAGGQRLEDVFRRLTGGDQLRPPMSWLACSCVPRSAGVAGNGEQLLLTLGIPVLLLVFFSLVDVLPTGTDDPIDFLAPGILALATMSTAMVSLGIGTGFERSYHVLKRLGTTPLGRPRLIAAKIGSVIAVEIVQFAVLIPVAFALGWNPDVAELAARDRRRGASARWRSPASA